MTLPKSEMVALAEALAMPNRGRHCGETPVEEPIAFAERAKTLPSSPLRALLSSARGNDRLDLAGGIPDPELFPAAELAAVARNLLADSSGSVLQYAPTEGLVSLRELIAQRLRTRGCAVQPDQILVTHGSQQALATVANLLASPSHAVALEQPVYPGAQQVFALAEAPTVALPVTQEGWELTSIRQRQIAAIYVIPDHQNPTGRRATSEQRLELARFAETTGAFVIEDDAYGELGFTGTSSRPIFADAPTRGILLGTFSKTLCPGLRVGWIAAPRVLIDPLVRILQASVLQPGTLAQHLAHETVTAMDWEAHLLRIRAIYSARAISLRDRCAELGLAAARPQGGFFLWVKTPDDATRRAGHAALSGVVVVPEQAFRSADHPGPNRHLRLSFSRYLDNAHTRLRLDRALRG